MISVTRIIKPGVPVSSPFLVASKCGQFRTVWLARCYNNDHLNCQPIHGIGADPSTHASTRTSRTNACRLANARPLHAKVGNRTKNYEVRKYRLEPNTRRIWFYPMASRFVHHIHLRNLTSPQPQSRRRLAEGERPRNARYNARHRNQKDTTSPIGYCPSRNLANPTAGAYWLGHFLRSIRNRIA